MTKKKLINKLQSIAKNNSSTFPAVSIDYIGNLIIGLPSLKEQERIVKILDKFDSLANDISEGIPAEIIARKKQYEYYRDKLLSFKEYEERKAQYNSRK